jgi:hypothetical protein
MSSPAKKKAAEPNFILDHPGVVASVFAIGVVVVFLGALLGPVLMEKGEHKGAEPAASGAPAPAGEKK